MDKKILIVTLEFPPQIGGIATYVHEMAKALPPERVVVLAPETTGSAEWDARQPYKIIRKKLLSDFFWPRWLKLCFLLEKISMENDAGIVFVHHALPIGYAAWWLKFRKKIPFTLFSHGTDLLFATRSKRKKKLFSRVAQAAEKIFFNSNSLRGRFLTAFPDLRVNTEVLYPCPPPDFFSPPEIDEVERLKDELALRGRTVILTVSRIEEGKGHERLLKVIPALLKKFPFLVWMVIGDGPKRDFILSEIRKRNLQNIVRFLGPIPNEQLKKYYYLSDLFALLTHPAEGKEEGLGLVFLEASACGATILAGKSGGVEEGVINGETGLVFDSAQSDENLAETITKLLSDKEYAKKLGAAAKLKMEQSFVWSEQLKKLN